jgi:hypothetical protein
MNAAGLPPAALVAILAGVVLLAVIGCLIAMTRTSVERRQRIGRILGQAFVVLIAIMIVAGMVAQFIR